MIDIKKDESKDLVRAETQTEPDNLAEELAHSRKWEVIHRRDVLRLEREVEKSREIIHKLKGDYMARVRDMSSLGRTVVALAQRLEEAEALVSALEAVR